jgi:N utilization substance protein B
VARRRARALALQALYGWLVNPRPPGELAAEARLQEGFGEADAELFDRLLVDAIARAEPLRASLAPLLDRAVTALSPVEHAVLLLGAAEMAHHPETPYRVVINEAVELAKTFGGTDGHKYVNGVLDRLAPQLRPHEAGRSADTGGRHDG